MAKAKVVETKVFKGKKKSKGKASKSHSKNKGSKNYKKPYRGQGKKR